MRSFVLLAITVAAVYAAKQIKCPEVTCLKKCLPLLTLYKSVDEYGCPMCECRQSCKIVGCDAGKECVNRDGVATCVGGRTTKRNQRFWCNGRKRCPLGFKRLRRILSCARMSCPRDKKCKIVDGVATCVARHGSVTLTGRRQTIQEQRRLSIFKKLNSPVHKKIKTSGDRDRRGRKAKTVRKAQTSGRK